MTDETLTDLHEFELPYSKRVMLRKVRFASRMEMTRLVFFEGKRVTQIDLDDAAAEQLGNTLLSRVKR